MNKWQTVVLNVLVEIINALLKQYKLHFMWMWSNMACDFLEEVHCISTFISINFILVINFYLCCLREVQNICTSQMMLCNMQIMLAICIDKPVLIHLFKHTLLYALHLSSFDDEILVCLKTIIYYQRENLHCWFFFSYWKGLCENYSLQMTVYNCWFHHLKVYHSCTIHLISI